MRLLFAALLFATPTLALAQGAMSMDHGAAGQGTMQAMERMNHAMPTQSTGDADRDFVLAMLPHHEGAVDMAKAELRDGKDPTLRKLAATIVKAQAREIAQMKRWLEKHPK